jgi:hypothetical protein
MLESLGIGFLEMDIHLVAIHDDNLGNFDMAWGGNRLLYRRNNTRKMTRNSKASNVGLVGHA